MRSRGTGALLAGVLTATLAGCGGSAASSGPPDVTVTAGPQEVTARPTQYCGDGEGQRYEVEPPVITTVSTLCQTSSDCSDVSKNAEAMRLL